MWKGDVLNLSQGGKVALVIYLRMPNATCVAEDSVNVSERKGGGRQSFQLWLWG